jgi:uncharacterized protein (DUF433 family)
MGPIEIIERGRGPELAGTRITVYDVLHYADAGHDAASIASVLRLSTAEVEALLRYAEEHGEEVRAAQRRIEERIARGNAPEVRARAQVSHEKLLALKAELERSNGEGPDRDGPPG